MIETRLPALQGNAMRKVARLSANESPMGPPTPSVREAIRGLEALHRYPRGAHQKLMNELAGTWKVDPKCLILTNGVDEAIDLLISLANTVWCTIPGFDAFWTRPEIRGIPVTRIPLDSNGQPTISASRIGPGGVAFIARPNNPTGTVVDEPWVTELPSRLDFVCIDETYIDFSYHDGFLQRVGEWPNLCVFRSLSKSLGLAGLRIGVVVAPPLLAAQLRERQRFYPVDTLALEVAAEAVADSEYVDRHRTYVLHQRAELVRILRESDLFVDVHDTQANFVIARCMDPIFAASMERVLAEHEVYVHECSLFGYPGRLRISVGSPEELHHLQRTLAYISTTDLDGK